MKLLSLVVIPAFVAFAGAGISQTTPASPGSTTAPAGPIHLLILFLPGAVRPTDDALLGSLKAVPSHGWLIAAERADGSMTGYTDKRFLWAALAAQSVPGQPVERSIGKALLDFKEQPQNGILVIDVAGASHEGLRAWAEPLLQAHVPVYLVDGGKTEWVAYNDSWGSINGPTPDTNNFGYEMVVRKRRYIKSGLVHEIKLKSAFKDVVKDRAHGFAIPATKAQ